MLMYRKVENSPHHQNNSNYGSEENWPAYRRHKEDENNSTMPLYQSNGPAFHSTMSVTKSSESADELRRQRRGYWSGAEFLFSVLSASVGLSALIRFPGLCYKYGAVFFVPAYLIMSGFIAIPVLCLEMFMGQFGGIATISAFGRSVPIAKGVGIAMIIVTFLFLSYYGAYMSWIVYYLVSPAVHGFRLPWSFCDNEWNTAGCVMADNNSLIITQRVTSSEEQFFVNHVLQPITPHQFTDIGVPLTHLVIILGAIWVVAFLVMTCGVKVFGKVAYLTFLVPFCLMIALLVRSLTLPGAFEGLRRFHFIPIAGTNDTFYEQQSDKYFKYKDPMQHVKLWHDATVQVFYSIGLGYGVYLSLASHNRFHVRVFRTPFIVMTVQFVVSMAFTVMMAAFAGFLAFDRKQNIENFTNNFTGLGFLFSLMPKVVARVPLPLVWSCLFYGMATLLAFGSLLAFTFSVTTSLMDELDQKLRKNKSCISFALLSAIVCVALFNAGLVFTTKAGSDLVNIFDHYAITWTPILLCLLFIITFAWTYTIKSLYHNINLMIASWDRCYLMAICWALVTPLLLAALLGYYIRYNWVENDPWRSINANYPQWTICLGWTCALLPIACIPLWVLYKCFYLCCARRSLMKLVTPSESWKNIEQERAPSYMHTTRPSSKQKETRSTQTTAKPRRKNRSAGDGWGGAPPEPQTNGGGPQPTAPPPESTGYQYRPIYPAVDVGESRF